MKNFHLCLLLLGFSLASLGFTKEADVLTRLRELKLDKYAEYLTTHDPDLVKRISKRNDITVWAPGNDAVTKQHFPLNKLTSRDDGTKAHNAWHLSNPGLVADPGCDRILRRGNDGGSLPHWPWISAGTNFETAFSFLQDPKYTNLGQGRVARFVHNYAAANGSISVESVAAIEVTTGLGDITTTVRGPFKFRNGIIYETSGFFTLPRSFSETMQHLNISRQFLIALRRNQKLWQFENSPAVTIFAPIDDKLGTPLQIKPDSYVVHAREQDVRGALLIPDLPIGYELQTRSGAMIKITQSADTGETLVNGRRFVKPNVIIKNGVIHFIDGKL